MRHIADHLWMASSCLSTAATMGYISTNFSVDTVDSSCRFPFRAQTRTNKWQTQLIIQFHASASTGVTRGTVTGCVGVSLLTVLLHATLRTPNDVAPTSRSSRGSASEVCHNVTRTRRLRSLAVNSLHTPPPQKTTSWQFPDKFS